MGKGVLEGIKVVEFAYIMVVPSTCSMLANHGAEVIRIETSTRLDLLRTMPPYKDGIPHPDGGLYFGRYSPNKYGVTLNLRHPKGVVVAKKLATGADIVADGFTTGALDRLGLGYEELKKTKPDIIMFSANTFGQSGPLASVPGTGIQIAALAGFVNLAGLPDGEPVALQPYTDWIVPHFNLVTVLAALDYRRRTGKGQHIDISHLETSMHFLEPLVLDYTANKRVAMRAGNCSPYAAPHGVYRCQGDDRWCAIAVFTDEEWKSFCKVLDDPQWTEDPRFSTLLGRVKNADDLDRLVQEWTINYSAEEVMTLMQEAGVEAGVVKNGMDIMNDPQLNHRHHFWMLDHPVMGTYPYEHPFCKLSRTPGEVRMPSPCLGQDNAYVFTKLLGMSDGEFVELLADGVFE